MINMGFFPAFVAYPLIRKALQAFPARVPRLAVIGAAVLGVELGALGVVTETALSGLASLHWKPFLIAFLPIHLAIGLLEGILTVAVLSFVLRLRPDRLTASQPVAASGNQRRTLLLFLLALVIAGGLSQVASSRPDGLEWSLSRARFEPEASLTLQDHVSPFPDYRLTDNQDNPALAGLVGVILTLGVLAGVLSVLRRRSTHSLRKGP
ncbi:MAG: hypothetical protein D6762_02880 [Candidatus Neomarinimicrobiota bacterium]|nr:MAG: hypothetical protein D6762_02880 [Candidatus Neomarinimicrobiota bacterium]